MHPIIISSKLSSLLLCESELRVVLKEGREVKASSTSISNSMTTQTAPDALKACRQRKQRKVGIREHMFTGNKRRDYFQTERPRTERSKDRSFI